MQLVLTVKERILVPGLLKSQGKFEDMVARQEIIEKVTFSAKEIEEYDIKQREDGSIAWNAQTALDKTIECTELEAGFLKKCLKELSEQEKLPSDATTLWKKLEA